MDTYLVPNYICGSRMPMKVITPTNNYICKEKCAIDARRIGRYCDLSKPVFLSVILRCWATKGICSYNQVGFSMPLQGCINTTLKRRLRGTLYIFTQHESVTRVCISKHRQGPIVLTQGSKSAKKKQGETYRGGSATSICYVDKTYALINLINDVAK